MTAFWDFYVIKKKEDILKIVITGPPFSQFQMLNLFCQASGYPHQESLRSLGGQCERQWWHCQVTL